MRIRSALPLLAALACSTSATAATVDWQLSTTEGAVLGTFTLDFATPAIINPVLSGFSGTYEIPSFTFLGTPDVIGPETVQDFLLVFSSQTGSVFTTDYGSGEGQSIRVNELAMRIGTLGRALSPAGGVFPVIIEEVFNYDETYFYCGQYEEFYDDDTGDYIQTGNCLQQFSDTDFNLNTSDWYYGFVTSAGTPDGGVPLPPALALLVGGLAGLGALRRRPAPRG
jgi:hypothetical protein